MSRFVHFQQKERKKAIHFQKKPMTFDIYKQDEIFSLVEMVKHQATKQMF